MKIHGIRGQHIARANYSGSWRTKLAALAASTILTTFAAAPGFAGDDAAQSPSTQTPIKHVVVIFGENESFDHYFGTYPLAENPEIQPPEPRFVADDGTPSADTLLGRVVDE